MQHRVVMSPCGEAVCVSRQHAMPWQVLLDFDCLQQFLKSNLSPSQPASQQPAATPEGATLAISERLGGPKVEGLAAVWRQLDAELDFAPEYVDLIRTGRKQATSRWLPTEPSLRAVVAPCTVIATCLTCAAGGQVLGSLNITSVEKSTFGSLPDSLALMEGFSGGSAALMSERSFDTLLSQHFQWFRHHHLSL